MIMENLFDYATLAPRGPRPIPRTVPTVTTRHSVNCMAPTGLRILFDSGWGVDNSKKREALRRIAGKAS